ncbi:MAG: tetratricopeptide repeat protein [Bacteroidia bacterium]
MLSENPYDLEAKMALATLLENRGDTTAAMNIFEEIVTRKPSHFEANLHLAAFYINRAYVIQENIKNQSAPLPASYYSNLEKAMPGLKVLHAAQPDNQEWIRQLAATTGILGLPEADGYKQLLEK